MLFRELEFSLEDIRKILKNPEFDREKALEQQITLLTLKKQHPEKLIALAEKIRTTGGNVMDFNAFDTQKIKEYAERAKREWGETTEYQEFEAKNARRTQKEFGSINEQLMGLVAAFGTLQTREPADPAVQAQVKSCRTLLRKITIPVRNPFCINLDRCTVLAASLRRTSTLPGERARQNLLRKPLKFIADKPKASGGLRLL